MSFKDSSEWGTWNFSSGSKEKLEQLKKYFKCSTCNSHFCHEINNDMWRLLIGEVISRNGSTETQNFNLPTTTKDGFSCICVDNGYLAKENEEKEELSPSHTSENLYEGGKEESKVDDIFCTKSADNIQLEDSENGNNDEVLESVRDICVMLNKGPVEGFTAKFKGKDLDNVLRATKDNLSTEESITNLIFSMCSPVEDDILEQSRWAPVLFQQLILPEILERSLPVSRLMSSAISQLASSFPDASVQFLCIPLLVAPLEDESSVLSSTMLEILMKIVEESLPPQQRIFLFRSFFKLAAGKEKLVVQENYFPILLLLAETPGAFTAVESVFLLNLIGWLEISSQEHFSNIKFAKFLVAVLKGIAHDIDSRKEGNARCLSPESLLRLKNVIAQNKTFLRKIAEKTLNSIS